MTEFKVVINDPKAGKSYNRTVGGNQANALIGKKIKDEVDGLMVGLQGFKLEITGGSDKDGTPMRPDLPGPRRKKILVSEGFGFHPKYGGERRRKTYRGNTISQDTVQINMKIVSHGSGDLEKLLSGGEEEKK